MTILSISADETRQLLASIGMTLNSHGQIEGSEVVSARLVEPPVASAALLALSREIVGLIPSTDWALFQFNFSGPVGADNKFQVARILFGPTASVEAVMGRTVKFDSDDSRHRFVLADLVNLTLVQELDADLVWSSSLGKEKITLQDGRLYMSSRLAQGDLSALFGPAGSLGHWVSDFNRKHEDG